MRKYWVLMWHSAALEADYIKRHPWEWALLLWLPLACMAVVWFAFANSQIHHLPVGVLDEDHSALSQQLVRYIAATPSVDIVAHYPSAEVAQQAMDNVEVYGVVVIPKNFAKHIKSGQSSPVVLQYNGQYSVFSGLIQRDVRQAVGTFSAGVEIKTLNKRGESLREARHLFSPIQTANITLFNANTDYRQFLAANVLPALLHILAMTAGAGVIGRELRDQTIGEWMAKLSQPCSDGHVALSEIVFALVGKLMWFIVAFTIWGACALWLTALLTPVDIAAWLSGFVGLWLFLVVSLWLGVLVTTLTMSLRMGLSMSAFITAPAFAFAGVTFPLMAMPEGARLWAECLPLTHYLKIQVSLFQMHTPIEYVYTNIVGFFIAAIALLPICAVLTRKALANPHKWGAR